MGGEATKYVCLILILFIIQAVVCLNVANNKHYLFTDEVYSYGLSNSEDRAFLDPGSTPELLDDWTSSSFFKDYTKYNTNSDFSFTAAFENQKKDVHPPLYYCLIHLVCALFPNEIYSALPGVILNVIFLFFTDFLLFYIAYKLTKSRYLSYVILLFWGLSSACFSNAVLIRMYMMQTFQILAFVAFNLYIKDKEQYRIIEMLCLTMLVASGGLTHYYFYIFSASFGVCTCICLLFKKQFQKFIKYAISLWLGILFALLIFPETITNHINGYRGTYATESIGSFSYDKFVNYFKMINNEQFAGLVKLLLLIFILYLMFKIICWFANITIEENKDSSYLLKYSFRKININIKQGSIKISNNFLYIVSILLATIVFFYVAVQGSEITNIRYIYPIFPLVVLIICLLVFAILKGKTERIAVSTCMIFISVVSIYTNGIDWSYKDYKNFENAADELKNDDCIIINRQNYWWNVLQGFNIYINMDEIRAMFDTDVSDVEAILNQRNTLDNTICIAFPNDSLYTNDEITTILDTIIACSSFTSYNLVYDYYTKVYELQ